MEEKMRKISTLLLLFFAMAMLSTSVLAASVSRSMPSRAAPGEDITVTLSASGVPVGETFTLEEERPAGWNLISWDIKGYQGDVTDVQLRTVENRLGYSFLASTSNPVITLVFRVPTTAANGNYAFDAVYFDSSGQSRSQGTVTVRTIACGDGVCEGSENTDSCPSDCPAAPVVTPPETPTTEPSGEAVSAGKASIIGVVVLVVVAAVAVFLYFRRKK